MEKSWIQQKQTGNTIANLIKEKHIQGHAQKCKEKRLEGRKQALVSCWVVGLLSDFFSLILFSIF